MDYYNQPRNSCPICNGKNLNLIHQHSFEPIEGISIFTSYDVTSCNDCGMLFANNIPSQADFDRYYATSNKYETETNEVPFEQSLYRIIYDYIPKNNKSLKIADFGCGQGMLLKKLLNDEFTNLYAVDTSISNCNNLSNIGINALCKSVFEITCKDFPTKLDIIVSKAVLEHVVCVKEFVLHMIECLDINGKLIIAVPGISLLGGGGGYDKPFREFSVEHINYFSFMSLVNLMKCCGMQPCCQLVELPTLLLVFEKNHIGHEIEYIKNSFNAVEYFLQKLDSYIYAKTPVMVWGIGSLCRYLLKNTRFSELNIVKFIDSDIHYSGKELYGKRIILPEQIDSNELIISATYSDNATIVNLAKRKFGLSNEIITLF